MAKKNKSGKYLKREKKKKKKEKKKNIITKCNIDLELNKCV